MTEAGIGRVLVASLHQGIADILPDAPGVLRELAEPRGLAPRDDRPGAAARGAQLPPAGRGGLPPDHAARRASTPPSGRSRRRVTSRRSFTRRLPRGPRSRAVLRLACRTVRQTYVGTRAIVRLRRGEGTVDLRGSLFCGIRDSSRRAALRLLRAPALSRFFELYSLPAAVRLGECRATGDRSCILAVSLGAGEPAGSMQTRHRRREAASAMTVGVRSPRLAAPCLGLRAAAATAAAASRAGTAGPRPRRAVRERQPRGHACTG